VFVAKRAFSETTPGAKDDELRGLLRSDRSQDFGSSANFCAFVTPAREVMLGSKTLQEPCTTPGFSRGKAFSGEVAWPSVMVTRTMRDPKRWASQDPTRRAAPPPFFPRR
jgi:hypothetical protein